MTSALQALVDATPPPPETAELDALLVAMWQVHARRAELLASLEAPIVLVTDEDRQLAELIGVRQRAWSDALEVARTALATQRLNSGKVRGYASTLAGEL